MAFCETAQKDCSYLDSQQTALEKLLIARASSDTEASELAANATRFAEMLHRHVQKRCTPEGHCGLIELAVAHAAVEAVLDLAEHELGESSGR